MWDVKIDNYVEGKTKIIALNSPMHILDWTGKNPELDEFVGQVERRGWRCLQKHEARVFLIQTPKNSSIVWMSWLGYRGSRWHVVRHFAIHRDKPTPTACYLAKSLAEKYQEEWECHTSPNLSDR